jgi:hypothetical protein
LGAIINRRVTLTLDDMAPKSTLEQGIDMSYKKKKAPPKDLRIDHD